MWFQLKAVGLDGAPIDITAAGFHAMLLQHEYDHLDGILYPMRMTDLSLLEFDTEPELASSTSSEPDDTRTSTTVGSAGGTSSFRIVPSAVAVVIAVPGDGFDSVTVNPSAPSTSVSPETSVVTVFDVSPPAKLTRQRLVILFRRVAEQ